METKADTGDAVTDEFLVDAEAEPTEREQVDRLKAHFAARQQAHRELRREESARGWEPPKSTTLARQLRAKRKSPRFLIDGLLGWNHNAVLGGQYKTGKTLTGLHCVACLVDGSPFLGRATSLAGRVAWWNGEMDPYDWLDYAATMNIGNATRVMPLHLRGHRMPIMDDVCAEWVVEWLSKRGIGLWVVDSWRKLCVWNGVAENDNDGGGQLTDRIDQIKAEAGCPAFLTLAHTPRSMEAGNERIRGMSVLDDWRDSGWFLTKDGEGTRYLSADGRNVGMEETALRLEESGLYLGTGNRKENRRDGEARRISETVCVHGRLNATALRDSCGIGHDRQGIAVATAMARGWIEAARQGKSTLYTVGNNHRCPHCPGTVPDGGDN